MTEKRFKLDSEVGFIDTQKCCGDTMTHFEVVVELNKLNEENEQLKKAEILANHRGEMISFANSLIDDLGSETMKEMWDKFREEKYEEWRNLE